MNNKKRLILFVVEGQKRDGDVLSNLTSVFFGDKGNLVFLPVPADMNIYMLYSVMKTDNFETDIVELLKEKVPCARNILKDYSREMFSEVYYFFDFDEHSNNLRNKENIKVLEEMFNVLDNETELGKLYISYPMLEAVRDFTENDCLPGNRKCYIKRSDFKSYKSISSSNPEHNFVKGYTFVEWKEIIYSFVMRSCCLFGIKNLNRDDFVISVNPLSIFNRQMIRYKKDESVFVLSSVPEFLIDYSEKYWNSAIQKKKLFKKKNKCPV